ncbi:MAG: hypothetical protein DRJ49_07185 [Thermoprotei archaeon]|nr:MAG: hypothetical protein DRJ49_07185 [Thermoprotei archaeon]
MDTFPVNYVPYFLLSDILRAIASTDDPGELSAGILLRLARVFFLTIVDLKDGKIVEVKFLEHNGDRSSECKCCSTSLDHIVRSKGRPSPRSGANIMIVLFQVGIRVETGPSRVLLI